jgi:AraC-like DNA-binding protein
MSTHILARPLFSHRVGAEPFTFYHERYQGFSAEAHVHDDLQILLPLSGRLGMVVAGAEHLLGPEWAILLQAGAPHSSTFLNGDLDFVTVYAPAAWLPELMAALGGVLPDDRKALVVRDARLWVLAQQLASEIDAPGVGTERMLWAGLEQLGVLLTRLLQARPDMPLQADSRVMRAVDRILRDHAEELTVEGLAAEVAMSPRHFERCFKEAVGSTPRRFLIEVRLGAARDLLARTDRAIGAIAWDVGFKNVSHFSDTFVKEVGLTPSAYRRRQGG